MFFLRVFFFTFLRFLAIMAAVYGLTQLDVSPLPVVVTMAIFSYGAHIFITAFFTWCALRVRHIKGFDVWLIIGCFTIGDFMLELTLIRAFSWYLHVPPVSAWQEVSVNTGILFALYGCTVWIVAWLMQKKQSQLLTPEGLRV